MIPSSNVDPASEYERLWGFQRLNCRLYVQVKWHRIPRSCISLIERTNRFEVRGAVVQQAMFPFDFLCVDALVFSITTQCLLRGSVVMCDTSFHLSTTHRGLMSALSADRAVGGNTLRASKSLLSRRVYETSADQEPPKTMFALPHLKTSRADLRPNPFFRSIGNKNCRASSP